MENLWKNFKGNYVNYDATYKKDLKIYKTILDMTNAHLA